MSDSVPAGGFDFPSTDWLRVRTQAAPHNLALIIGESRWRYADLDRLVDQWAGWFHQQDLTAGTRLGVLLPNSLAYVCLVHACARTGVVLITLNTRLTGPELRQQLETTGCRVVIAASNRAGLEGELRVIVPPSPEELESFQAPDGQQTETRLNSLDAVQAIVFTSGTTGRPKAVPVTFRQHFFNAIGSAFKLGVHADDLWLSCLPLYHVGGLAILFRSCLYGTAVDLHPRFDAEAIDRALNTKPITLISLVPTMLRRLFDHGVGWPASLRQVLLGGAATPPALVAEAAAEGLPVSVSYGMTEAASQIATMLPGEAIHKPGSVGRPLLYCRVKVVAGKGEPAPAGSYGDIWVSGPQITPGYLDLPDVNAERFVDGWFKTGDIGYLDEDGDLWIVQRRSDLIISGGENVYPAEIEQALRAHPDVVDIAVVGVDDTEWGQRVAAMVVASPETALTAQDLIAFGRERLAGYKLPRLIQFVEALPQTASGKVARREIAERLKAKAANFTD